MAGIGIVVMFGVVGVEAEVVEIVAVAEVVEAVEVVRVVLAGGEVAELVGEAEIPETYAAGFAAQVGE